MWEHLKKACLHPATMEKTIKFVFCCVTNMKDIFITYLGQLLFIQVWYLQVFLFCNLFKPLGFFHPIFFSVQLINAIDFFVCSKKSQFVVRIFCLYMWIIQNHFDQFCGEEKSPRISCKFYYIFRTKKLQSNPLFKAWEQGP